MQWIQDNFPQLVVLMVALCTAGAAIAKFTPTPKDDEWFARLLAWLNLLPVSARAKLAEAEAVKAKAKAEAAQKK